MIQRKKKKLKDKKESARFVELAGQVLKDGAEKDFEEAFQKIIKSKRPNKKKPKISLL